MIVLDCNCNKKSCRNQIRISDLDRTVMIDHEIGGTDLLMYGSVSRLRRFALDILRTFPDERHKAKKAGNARR